MGRREDSRQTGRKIYVGLISLTAVCSILGLFLYFRIIHYTSDEMRTSDIERVNAEKPACLLLSMLQTESFRGEDFSYFRGMSTVKAEHRFENLNDIGDFLGAVEESPAVVYMAIDPVYIGSRYGFHASLYGWDYRDKLLSVVRRNADTTYEILLAHYPLQYWESLSDREREEAISSYRDFVNIFGGESNVKIFFLGAEEWLIANPANYETENSCNEVVTRTIIAFTIKDDTYRLTVQNMEDKFALIRTLAENGSTEPLLFNYLSAASTDLRDTDIVFFGDSIIGNFTGSLSIPGVVAGFLGARTYNLGVGGTAATFGGEGDLSLHSVMDAFFEGDASRFDDVFPVKSGVEEYVSDHADGGARSTCFILNFGLNDYFAGLPVDVPMSADERSCYTGALRLAVMRLREVYPDCRIILMTPGYSALFEGGTQVLSPEGGVLRDYVDAVLRTADEVGVEVFDSFNELGVGADNVWTYTPDGVHPNVLGRYVIGRRLAWHLLKN